MAPSFLGTDLEATTVARGEPECPPRSRLSSVAASSPWPARETSPIGKTAADLGIVESCLRRWLKQDDLDTGRATTG